MSETTATEPQPLTDRDAIERTVHDAVHGQQVIDIHTHLYPPAFGTPTAGAGVEPDPNGLMLWGIDELLTYHYLIAELFRVVPAEEMTPQRFWELSKAEQADLIWKHLFLARSPISEACRGVLTTLQLVGLDPAERDLNRIRAFFAEQEPDAYVDRMMELAGVESITMTNDLFDDNERQRWLQDPTVGEDPRFSAVVRFDALIADWPNAARRLAGWGYDVDPQIGDRTLAEVRRFLEEWIDRTGSIYAAISLPPGFRYPADEAGAEQWAAGEMILAHAVLPLLRERGLPMALMIGAQRGVNPELRQAGDMGFRSDVASLTRLCGDFPDNRFLVTMLSREDQHELAVAARTFGNLMIFGCWWFLNNPFLIEEITRMRCELLGTSFIPQHSDCRVLEQLTYKWAHSRRIIAKVLTDKYADLAATGWAVTEEEIRRDVRFMFRENFLQFIGR